MRHFHSEKILKALCETPRLYTIGPKMTTSHCLSPIYADMRRCYSDPKSMRIICKEIIKFISAKKIKFDFVVGGATAGIPLGTALGLLMNKPFGYVRKQPKDGGMGLAVEGGWRPGMTALLIDDAAAHGASKIPFVHNIRAAGMKINWVIVPVARTLREPNATKDHGWIKQEKIQLQAFCDINDMGEYAYKHKIISHDAYLLYNWYASDPHHWQDDKKKWQFFQDYLKMPKHDSRSGV